MSDNVNPSVPSQAAPSQAISLPAAGGSRRRRLPRFGLRTTLIVAVVFCLLMGWIGRNAYRMRQEEAAIDALMRAGAVVMMENDEKTELHPATPFLGTEPRRPTWRELVGGITGWSSRRPVWGVNLQARDSDDPNIARALAGLAWFPEIRSIGLSDAAFDNEAIQSLGQLPRLEKLAINRTTITGDRLALLARNAPLQELSIVGEAPSSHLLGGAPAFRHLKSLRLDDLSITRADVEAISSLPKLERLHLLRLRPARGEEVYAPLVNAQNLRFLNVDDSGMQDEDFVTLSQLPALEEAWVGIASDTNVSTLGPMPRLKKIYLDGPITADGARTFSAAHPDVDVGYRIFYSDGRWFHAGNSEWDR